MAQNYQRPDSVAPSVYGGFVTGQSLGDSLERAGKAALYGAAENAGPLAAGIITAPLAAEGAADATVAGGLLRGGVMAADGLQALAGVRDAKARAGLDPNQVTTTDILNAGGQTALNALHLGDGPGLLKPALGAAYGAAKGALSPLASDAGALAQGGTLTANQVGSDLLEGGSTGGLIGAAGALPGAARDATGAVIRAATDPMRAGAGVSDLTAYQRSQANWDQAVAAEKAKLAADPSGLPPDGSGFQETAEANAVANGAVKPDLTPDAQKAAARLALLQMYQQRAASEPQRGTDGKADANTFKGIADDLKQSLTGMAGGMLASGLIDGDQHKAFIGAIAEAAKHNRNLAEDGAANGYLETALDQVKATPLDPVLMNTFVGGLRVLDDASSNGLIANTKGPLQRNAGTILPIVGGLGGLAGGVFAGMGPGVEIAAAGLGKKLAQAVGTSWLRGLDAQMGWNKPQALDGADAIMRLAQARGLQPAVTSGDITGALQDLGNLRQTPPGAGLTPMPPMAQGAPVTTPGRPYVGMPQPTPVSGQESPLGPPTASQVQVVPQGQQGPVASPQGPTAAPVGVDPLRTAAIMARAQQAQAEAQQAATVQAIRQAAPTDRRAWSASMADTMGVQHAPMMDALKALMANSGQDPSLLEQSTLPRPIMSALTDHVGDLRDAGVLPLASNGPGGGGGGGSQGAPMTLTDQMRLASYQASLRQEAEAANSVRSQAPVGVAVIQAQSTMKGRQAALRTYLEAVQDPQERARQEALLAPLTLFGSKRDADGP
jgi:hypothetical protein